MAKFIILANLLFILQFAASSCVPSQANYEPLEYHAQRNEAFVRLYAAPIPYVPFAIHCWYVIKQTDDPHFHRWELWQSPGGPHGHVRLNLMEPTGDVGAGGTYIIAELSGPQAEKVAAFIQEASPEYPYRHEYTAFPGPNSNTYIQWVLDRTGWDVDLAWRAIGHSFTVDEE